MRGLIASLQSDINGIMDATWASTEDNASQLLPVSQARATAWRALGRRSVYRNSIGDQTGEEARLACSQTLGRRKTLPKAEMWARFEKTS